MALARGRRFWFLHPWQNPQIRANDNSEADVRQQRSASQASSSSVLFLIRRWSAVLTQKDRKLAGQLGLQQDAEIGYQEQEGDETDLYPAFLWAQHLQLSEKQLQEPAVPFHGKTLDKWKLKGNSRHLSISARSRSITDCPRCQRREGNSSAAPTHHPDLCHRLWDNPWHTQQQCQWRLTHEAETQRAPFRHQCIFNNSLEHLHYTQALTRVNFILIIMG